MANLDDEPETFDIMRMNRQVEARQRVKRYLRVTSGLVLVGLGAARGRLLGLGLVAIGVNLITKQLTGRSIFQHARSQLAPHHTPALARAKKHGNGARDSVDEASWESFPASDPPGYYPGMN